MAQEDGSIGDIDGDYALVLLKSSLWRTLNLTEVRYLEQCIFSGPATIEGIDLEKQVEIPLAEFNTASQRLLQQIKETKERIQHIRESDMFNHH